MQFGQCYRAHALKGRVATSYSTLMLLQRLSGPSETGETLLPKQKINSFNIGHSLMRSVMGQLSFKIKHKLECSTELDLSSKCSHAQLYVFLESFLKTYHNKLDCRGLYFFNPWKRTHWKTWPQSHSLLQTFTETWCNIISNFVVFKQLIKM